MTLALEHRAPTDSLLSQWDARWKLAAILLAVVCIALLRHWPAAVAALGVAFGVATLGRLPRRWFRLRMGALSVGLLPFLLILPFTLPNGLSIAVTLACKALAIGALMLTLLATGPLPETMTAAQRLKMPGVLVQLTLLSYRYVFLLAEEFARLRTALRVRGFRNRANRHSYRTVGRVTGTLLVRGQERAERVAQAMASRGFDGRFRSLVQFRTTLRDVALFAILTLSYSGLWITDFGLIGGSSHL